jgi:hypothetical protein
MCKLRAENSIGILHKSQDERNKKKLKPAGSLIGKPRWSAKYKLIC